MTRRAPTKPSPGQPLAGYEPVGERPWNFEGVLRLAITNDAGHWTLRPVGEIDLASVRVLEQAIHRAEASAAHTVTIDLRHVCFIDLSGVQSIVDAHGRLGGRLSLRRGPPGVQAVFRASATEAGLPFEDQGAGGTRAAASAMGP